MQNGSRIYNLLSDSIELVKYGEEKKTSDGTTDEDKKPSTGDKTPSGGVNTEGGGGTAGTEGSEGSEGSGDNNGDGGHVNI